MIPYLFEKDETTFETCGLGALPSWIENTIEVIEERNGEYYLQGELPVGGLHVDELAEERIIWSAPAPGEPAQPFRIRRVEKPDESDTVQVTSHHVSYQLTENICKPTNFRTASAQQALDWLTGQGHMVPQIDTTLWSFSSDIVLAAPVQIDPDQPMSVRATLGGEEMSLVDIFGGELEWDNWAVLLHQRRGRDTGKVIRYGVNLESVSFVVDVAGLITCYYGYWRDSDGGFYKDARIDMPNIGDYAYPRVAVVDLSGKVEYGETTQNAPTDAQMLAALQAYVDERDENHLYMYITTGAVPDDLQDLKLCDTATVIHPNYSLDQTVKLVKTVFDPIKEKYKQLTFGELQRNITDTIAGLLRGVK